MRVKRYTPETALQRVIEALEDDDPNVHEQAVVDLLQLGPLLVSDTIVRRPQDSTRSEVRAELLAFLRSTILNSPVAGMGLHRPASFRARTVDGRVVCEADGDGRDLVLLQLVLLLHQVGLPNVRVCKAGDCRRMFVKLYRREFCSARCQKRAYMRQRRENERAKRERARLRRQRKGA